MRPRKPHVEQKPVVEDTPLQRPEDFFLDMTPDELAEYNADPGPEYYEEMERHKRHIVCLHAFGYLVESPVADRQEKWLKFRADQSKATRSKNKLETKSYQTYRDTCVDCMADCAIPDASLQKKDVAEWYQKHTAWPEDWVQLGAAYPPKYAKVPSLQTVEVRLLPALEDRLGRKLYYRNPPRRNHR